MRTTITLEDDVAAAIDHRRREEDKGISEIVNELVRKGLTVKEPRKRFVQKTYPMGMKIDVSNVAEAIAYAEGDDWK
jgi:metal-responsive CopG/Arc/MetJ family transcriptional regulator